VPYAASKRPVYVPFLTKAIGAVAAFWRLVTAAEVRVARKELRGKSCEEGCTDGGI